MAVIQANRESIDDRFSVLGFTVRTENPLFEIGLATDPELLKAENRQRRTASNFFSSRVLGAAQSRPGEAIYLVPPNVVARFVGQPKLYFGLATYAEGDRSRPVSVRIPDRGNMYVSLSGLTERGLRRTARSDGAVGYGAGGDGLAWGGDALASTSKASNGNGAAATTAPRDQPAPYSDGYSDELWRQPGAATAPAPRNDDGNAATAAAGSPGNGATSGAPVSAQAHRGADGGYGGLQPQPAASRARQMPLAQPLLVSAYYRPTGWLDALRTQIGFFVSSAMWFLGVSDTTVPPHSAICQVRRPDGSAEGALHGSAFFIAPRLLLTAAHVVDGQSELIIVPGKNGGGLGTTTEPFGRFRVSSANFRKHPSYGAGGSDFDMALIRVPTANAARADNYFDLVEELTQSRPEGVVVCGYAARWYADDLIEHFVNDNIDPNRQHLHGGHIRSLPTDDTFDYDLQTLGGTSGSPVYWIEEGNQPRAHMVGVHVAAHTETTNLGCRITPAKLSWIRSTAAAWGEMLTFSLGASHGAARAATSRALGGASAKFNWPAGMAQGNALVRGFIEAYDARIDNGVSGAPAPDPTQFRSHEDDDGRARAEALRTHIPAITAALQSSSGRHEVSEAILALATAASMQVFEQIKDRLPATFYAPISTNIAEPPPEPSADFTLPRIVPELSRRIGMFMAWVDVAIQQATSDTAERLRYQKQEWEGMLGLLGAGGTMIGLVPGLGTGAAIVGLAVQGVLTAMAPDFERRYSSFAEAMQAVRANYRALAASILQGLIQQRLGPRVSVDVPLHPDVQGYLDAHAAHALLGWQNELAFLGADAPPARGLGNGVHATAQEIITPFYDPADPASALRSQADAFSLAREEWFAGVPNTTIFPHSAICLLEMRDAGGRVGRGTGFYIGRNRILTCAHNLYGQASVEIVPGKNGQGGATEPFGRCTVTSASWRIPASYGGSNPAYDLAVIDGVPIAAPGERWFDALEELNQSRPEGVIVCGYSSRSERVPELTAAFDGFKQHLHAGYIAALGAGDSTFDYPILTLKRASGSPVYYISDKDGAQKAYIVGVHTGSATADLNRGCRLTTAKIDWIEGRATTLALSSQPHAQQWTQGSRSLEIPLDPGIGGQSIGLEALSPGDIIVSTARHPVSYAIRAGTLSAISHAMLYVGDGNVVEAVGSGVREVALGTAIGDAILAVAYRDPRVDASRAAMMVDFARAQLGRPYNYGGVARAGYRIVNPLASRILDAIRDIAGVDDASARSFYCSELVFAAFDAAGIPLVAAPSDASTPHDVVQLTRGSLGYVGHLKARDELFGIALGVSAPHAHGLAGETPDYPVGLIPQPNKDACWAAAMAMLLSWRRQASIPPEVIVNEVGGSLASSYNWDLLEAVRARYGFEMIAQPSNTSLYHSPQQWAEWLDRFGPLWVVIVGAPHAVVIAGIRGNLSDPASVQVKVLNPWDTRVAFDGDPVSFHPANSGYEDWLAFEQFAADFGNMAEPDYGNWRVLHLPATAAGAQALGASFGTSALRLARPPAVRTLQASADTAGGPGETREPVEPSRVPGTRMSVLRGSAGASRWSLDQLEGQKAPAMPGPAVSQSDTTEVNIELGAWPALEGQAAPLPLIVSFRTTAQGTVGDVRIRAGASADPGHGVEVIARIEDDGDVGNVATVRIGIDYRFNGFAQDAPAARIELRLLGDGRYERVNRWLTTAQAA